MVRRVPENIVQRVVAGHDTVLEFSRGGKVFVGQLVYPLQSPGFPDADLRSQIGKMTVLKTGHFRHDKFNQFHDPLSRDVGAFEDATWRNTIDPGYGYRIEENGTFAKTPKHVDLGNCLVDPLFANGALGIGAKTGVGIQRKCFFPIDVLQEKTQGRAHHFPGPIAFFCGDASPRRDIAIAGAIDIRTGHQHLLALGGHERNRLDGFIFNVHFKRNMVEQNFYACLRQHFIKQRQRIFMVVHNFITKICQVAGPPLCNRWVRPVHPGGEFLKESTDAFLARISAAQHHAGAG